MRSQVHNVEGAKWQRRDGVGLINNLKTHEVERKAREEKVSQKKKVFAFKSTPTISDEDKEEDDDEDLSLLVKNVRRMYDKAKFENRRRSQGMEKNKKKIATIAENRVMLLSNARRPRENLLQEAL